VNCPTYELSEFLDGALAPDRAAAAEKHVRECPGCAGRVREERALRRGLLVLACPSADVLGHYLEGSLDTKFVGGVKEHVRGCGECSEVIEWTREAALSLESGELPKASGRRRRPALPKRTRQSRIISFALPLAAAAAVIVAVLVFTHEPARSPSEGEVAERPALPVGPALPKPPSPERAAPSAGQAPGPGVTPQENEEGHPANVEPGRAPAPAPEVTPLPSPETPPGETPVAPPATTPRPGDSERPSPVPPPVVEPQATVAIANAGGDLRVGPSREKATRVTGSTTLGPSDLVFASMAPGRFDMGGTPVLLAASSEARLEPARLLLEKGESWTDGASLELSCHGASAKPVGTAQLLLRAAPHGAQLYVCSGQATFASAGGQVSLGAGETSEVEADAAPTRPHPGTTSPWLAEARADRSTNLGLDYPRGFLADEAARSLAVEVATGKLPARARALHAIEAARASDERFARIVTARAGAAADAAFDEIVNGADALSAPEAALAVLARARRLPTQKEALGKTFAAVAKTLERATPVELDTLAKDSGALLALKALERAGAHVKLRERVLAEPVGAASDLDWLARATLAGVALDPADVDARIRKLDQALGKDAVVPANRLAPRALLAAGRALAALGHAPDEERRSWKFLEHLAAAGPKPCAGANAATTLLVLAQDAFVVAGRAPAAPAPSSVTILIRKDGQLEVTFVFESVRNPRSVILGGSWDSWLKEKEPMTRRHDGTFVQTIVLPRGRYPYKFHLENGPTWETDPRNPLYESDTKGGNNSVLDVE
jgi:hypothetical protein